MELELKKIISKLKGNVLIIGFENNVFNEISSNKKIINCDTLNEFNKLSTFESGEQKVIYIQQLNKLYKNKSIDYIVVKGSSVNKHLNHFIIDSINLCSENIYIFNEFKNPLYNMYTQFIDGFNNKKIKNFYIYKIEVKNIRINYIKRIFFVIKYNMNKIFDKITSYLTS